MNLKAWTRGAVVLGAVVALFVGCGKPEEKKKDAPVTVKQAAKDAPKHDGWWCDEHGVPEKDCSMCLPEAEVKKRFKDKDDWCEKHERAKSQCFICDPTLKEKFAAQYRAKYGKEPPEPKENMPSPAPNDTKKEGKE